jgi:hypothetical protein
MNMFIINDQQSKSMCPLFLYTLKLERTTLHFIDEKTMDQQSIAYFTTSIFMCLIHFYSHKVFKNIYAATRGVSN